MLPRLLIVSDDPFLGALYVEKFEAVGCAVELVRDAVLDRRTIEGFGPHGALVVVAAPLGAREAVHAIRSAVGTAAVPIAVLTDGDGKGTDQFGNASVLRKAAATPTEVVAAVRRSIAGVTREV